jgi:hypothetical protein
MHCRMLEKYRGDGDRSMPNLPGSNGLTPRHGGHFGQISRRYWNE